MTPFTNLSLQIIQTIAKFGLAEQIRDGIVDFLASQAKDLGNQEVSERISRFCSDNRLRTEVQAALERAAKRWAESCPDRELVAAVAQNTRFNDLASVRQAVFQGTQHPFDPLPVDTITKRFSEVLPTRFEALRVRRGVCDFLDVLREELISVSGLQETQHLVLEIQQLRAAQATAEYSSRLDNIERILFRLENGPTPTEDTLRQYLSWVVNQNRYLDPRGTLQTVRQVQVKLDEIYVSLLAEPELPLGGVDRRIYENEAESLLAQEDLTVEEKENIRENLLAQILDTGDVAGKDSKTRDLNELVLSEPKLVILGDPGAGKTTLLRYLAYQQAQALLLHLNTPNESLPSITHIVGSPLLPLYLRIADYAEQNRGRSLANYLPHNVSGDENAPLPHMIEECLIAGSCLVMLDGLDEVIETSHRGEIAAQINSLIRTYERNHFVITSRVVGYRSAMLAGDIQHYRIQDMNDEQIQRFLNQWCNAVERFQTPDLPETQIKERAQSEIDEICRSISQNSGVRRLASNPLLLRTLALIHRTGSRLPQRRIDLYRLAADTLIRDWELARGIPESVLVQEAEATPMLAELAAWLHDEKPAGIATRGEVRHKLAEVKSRLDDEDPEHSEVRKAVDHFLDRIRQHTGLFVERAPNRYGFMHLTFEEYFAARYLVAKPKQAARRVRSKLHNPRWREPILLAIAFYGTEFPDDVDELVREAILGENLGGPSQYEDILHRDLLFAVRCMGDQDLGAKLRDKLVREFVRVWQDDVNGAGKYIFLKEEMVKVFQEIEESQAGKKLLYAFMTDIQDQSMRGCINRIHALGFLHPTDQSTAVLLSALQNNNPLVRASAAQALANNTSDDSVVHALLQSLRDEDGNVRANVARALANATNQAEVVSVLLLALRDEDWNVRTSAAKALAKATKQADVVTFLLRSFQEEQANVRASAALALVNATSQTEVVTSLLKALQEEKANTRASAAQTLAFAAGQIEVMQALLLALQDRDANVRASAAEALANATSQVEVVSALLNALLDENPFVRGIAADALRNATIVKDEVSGLLNALKDNNWFVRARAAEALANAANQANVLIALLHGLKDEDGNVRASAVQALANATDHVEVVSALLIALHDEDVSVRASAARALSNATHQSEVVPALLKALEDKNEIVRKNASVALYIGSSQAATVATLIPYLGLISNIIASSKPSLKVIVFINDLDESEYAAPYDYLFQILRMLAPGPCR